MRVFHFEPVFLRLAHNTLVLIGNGALRVVDTVADIGLIVQDTFHLGYRPGIRFFRRGISIDVSKGSVSLKVVSQSLSNLSQTHE